MEKNIENILKNKANRTYYKERNTAKKVLERMVEGKIYLSFYGKTIGKGKTTLADNELFSR